MEQLVPKLQREVRKNLATFDLNANPKLVVAVSGGADSITLFDILLNISRKQGLNLHAAHLNHGVRTESKGIAEYLSQYFTQMEVPFTLGEVNVPQFQVQSGRTSEEAARYLRYKFLTNVFQQEQADAIAIAHTLDDQAETILMNLIRGSGIRGLGGIKPFFSGQVYPDLPSATYIRPLLTISKAHTEQYSQQRGLQTEDDQTNSSLLYTRNRIRHQLLPTLEDYNPAIRTVLFQLGVVASGTADLINTLVKEHWEAVTSLEPDGLVLNRPEFNALHPALKVEMLRTYIENLRGSLEDIDYKHYAQMLSLMEGPSGKYTVLPGGAVFKVNSRGGTLIATPL